ncbi:Transposase, partial [Tistlia consotensis]
MERDGKMGGPLGVSKEGYAGRLEVLSGPTGRRQRTEADKARIVAESLLPDARVAEVARKHGVTRWQIYDWRKKLRKGHL